LRFLTYPFLRSGERSEKMPVFRVSKNRDFTVIANSVFKDRRLSAKAKGILVEMLSLPENWDYTLKGLTTLFSDGIDSIRQGIKELEENGYIVRERKRDARGRLSGMEYVIYETPEKAVENSVVDDTPVKDFPVQDESAEDKAMLYKELNKSRTKESITHVSNPYQSITEEAAPDVMGYDEARETVKENIEYGILSERYPVERLDEIVDIASEALCSKRSTFSLGKDTYPYALVKDRLLRLDSSHIEYILDCIDGNTTDIRNIKPYMLKTLINAPATMDSYYRTKVNHDLYGGDAACRKR
jgi:hypothetical protein